MAIDSQHTAEEILYFTEDPFESDTLNPVTEFSFPKKTSEPLVTSTDSIDYLEELVVFRAEIREELEKHKEILKSFKEVFDTLKQSHNMLQAELKQKRQEQKAEQENQEQTLLRPILLEMIEIRDRIETGLGHYRNPRVRWWHRLLKQENLLLQSFKEGQLMTLRRLDQLLSRFDVGPIQAINHPFDPRAMRAIAIDSFPEKPKGQVTQEFRKGYAWKDEILRIAEVAVNN